MRIPTLSIPATQHRALYFGLLLVSGLLTVVGFAIIASGRIASLNPALASFTLRFAQFEMFALTAAKLGVEQFVFAEAGQDEHYFSCRRFLVRVSLPIAVGFAAISYFIFSGPAAVAIVTSVLFDTASVVTISQLYAKERRLPIVVATLLNYPAFFLLYFIFINQLTAVKVLLFFVTASAGRWLYLSIRQPPATRELPVGKLQLWTGLQQVLNYWLFKADQIFVSCQLDFLQVAQRSQILYLLRFPEMTAGVATTAGLVWFPVYHLRRRPQFAILMARLLKSWPLLLGGTAIGAVTMVGYCLFFKGPRIPLMWATLYFVQAILILPVNNLTYSFFRHRGYKSLVWCLVVAIAIGEAVYGVALFAGSHSAIALLVPCQLFVFLLAGLRRFPESGQKASHALAAC